MGVYDWAHPPGAVNGRAPRSGAGATAYGQAALQRELQTLTAATEGTRNDTLNRVAFSLAQLANAGHLVWGEVCAELEIVAHRIGLGEREIRRTLLSAATASVEKPRTQVPDSDPAGPTPTVLHDTPDHSGFWDQRPVLGHLRDFARARRVGPWALLGATLARTIAMVPPLVVLPPLVGAHASLNLFVGLVGRSGAGKGGAEVAAADAMTSTETLETITAGSGEAIAHAFMERRKNPQTGQLEPYQHTNRVLVSIAEVDTLGALHARTAATIMPELRKAWMGERLGFHYVDLTKRLPVPAHSYRLCMIVGIQPERAATLLNDTAGGTPQRFVWLPATDPDAPDIAPSEPSAWDWKLPHAPMVSAHGHAVLPVCDSARQVIDRERLDQLRGTVDALDGHALLARLKVAAALALLDQRPEVAQDDWELAGTVMAVSDHTRAAVITALAAEETQRNKARGVAEAQRAVMVDERQCEAAVNRVKRKILKHLQKVESESRGRLRNWLSSRDREYFEDAIDRLVEESYVDLDETSQGPRYQVRK